MTDEHGDIFGTGPDGLVVPGDLDEEGVRGDRLPAPRDLEDRETLSGQLYRLEDRIRHIERLLGELVEKVPERRDVNAHAAELRGKFDRVLDRLLAVTAGLAGVRNVPADVARKDDVELVLDRQHRDFGWVREHLTFLRGVASVRDSGRRGSGVAALCALWVLTVLAAFGAGAVTLGFVSVDVAWRGDGTVGRASVSGVQPRVEEPETRLPRVGREVNPSVRMVEPPPVIERPWILAAPSVEEDENAARGRGRPEEHLDRREDWNGSQSDVLPDGAP